MSSENSLLGDESSRCAVISVVVNAFLCLGKLGAGFYGNSYALIADGLESLMDIFGSALVFGGIMVGSRPPDENHPYGHGKAESLAAIAVSIVLLGVACAITWQSIQEIRTPHSIPKLWTLWVIVGVIVTKEGLFRYTVAVARASDSPALAADAKHHRADSLTSLAAFVGISISVFAGDGWESADDWAALIACSIIFYNGFRLLKESLDGVMDTAAPEDHEAQVREIAEAVSGVEAVEKCRIRRSGRSYLVDIHIQVEGKLSVSDGHDIAHEVKNALATSEIAIIDTLVHIEPFHTVR